MSNTASVPKPPYRKFAFLHWLNLSVLALGGLASLQDPSVLVALVPLEAGILWILPDLPFFRAWADKTHTQQLNNEERAFYLEQLFGMKEKPNVGFVGKLKTLFVNTDPETGEQVDGRIANSDGPDARRYLEMRSIIRRLRELTGVRGARITETELNRFEGVVNGWLRLLIACRPLQQAISRIDERSLKNELTQIERKLEAADGPLRPVLNERIRLLQSQLERVPRLQATLELFRTQADAIYYQLHNVHSQVLTDPGTDVQGVLNDMIEKNDMLADPLGQLESDQLVRDMMEKVEKRSDGKPDDNDSDPGRPSGKGLTLQQRAALAQRQKS